MAGLQAVCALGARTEAQKLSLRAALSIEEDLLNHGWDGLIGSQKALQDRFGLGRCAFRETAKVLEMRGSARTKRGPQGGLWAVAPNLDNFARHLAAFLVLSRGQDGALRAAVDAADSLKPLRRENAAEAFLAALLDRVAERIGAGGPSFHLLAFADHPDHTLNELCYARQLAVCIIDDITHSDGSHPRCIGSEWDLAERYGHRLETIRQASRMLEGMALVEVRMGRKGGIFTRAPQLMLSRAQLFSYLSTEGVTADEADVLAARMRVRSGPIFDALLEPIASYADWAAPAPVPVPAAA